MFLSKLELLDFGDSNDEATEAEQVDHAIGDLGQVLGGILKSKVLLSNSSIVLTARYTFSHGH